MKTEAGRRDIPLTTSARKSLIKQKELDLLLGRMQRQSAHILRHTACTRLTESGLEPKVLQYIMGHANISITLDVYTHLDFSQIQKKMEEVQKDTKIG